MTVSTVMVEEVSEKQGQSNGKPWTRYAIKDGNGDWYSTFEAGVALPSMKGQRVEIEWEQNGNFRNLLRATPAEEPPTPGTGKYIKGKEPPETQRAIHASVALDAAIAWVTVNDDARATLSEHGVLLVAGKFYEWLRARAEGEEQAGTRATPSGDELPL